MISNNNSADKYKGLDQQFKQLLVVPSMMQRYKPKAALLLNIKGGNIGLSEKQKIVNSAN